MDIWKRIEKHEIRHLLVYSTKRLGERLEALTITMKQPFNDNVVCLYIALFKLYIDVQPFSDLTIPFKFICMYKAPLIYTCIVTGTVRLRQRCIKYCIMNNA